MSATGSGTFGSDSFSNAAFTITSTADTANITEANLVGQFQELFLVPDITATVFVSGVGTGTFTGPTESIDNQYGAFGVTSTEVDLDFLDVQNDEFISYNLSTSLGPVTGPALFTVGFNYATTDGNFSITSVYYNTVTFQAEIVPEPPAIELLAVATLLLIWQRRSRLLI